MASPQRPAYTLPPTPSSTTFNSLPGSTRAYAHAYASTSDARTRGRVKLPDAQEEGEDVQEYDGGWQDGVFATSTAIPTDLLFPLLLSRTFLSLSLFLLQTHLLPSPTPSQSSSGAPLIGSSLVATSAVLIGGAVIVGVKERPWRPRGSRSLKGKGKAGSVEPSSVVLAICTVAEMVCFFSALSRLSVLRVLMLTAFCRYWSHGLPTLISTKGQATHAKSATLVSGGVVAAAFATDAYYLTGSANTNASLLSGYVFLALSLFFTGSHSDLISAAPSLANDSAARRLSVAKGTVLAALLSLPLAAMSWAMTPASDIMSSLNAPSSSSLLPSALLYSLSYYLIDPLVDRTVCSHVPVPRHFANAWPVGVLSTVFVGSCAFGTGFGGMGDFFVGLISYLGISNVIRSDPRFFSATIAPGTPSQASSSPVIDQVVGSTNVVDRAAIFYRRVRAVIKTILENPDSRKIYYFLCLNLAYMLVQMMYGIWTNSLGLISDSIHMFFDCMALGMGLLASVMATWARDDRFTYGYGRVETLSGFANGVFLILISIFIVFEAIQRLIDPPDMNTNQLLVVSMIGLGVNLVGMFATGHHHHGHSHGHSHGGHDHGHSHGHSQANSRTSHDHGHDHGHSHDDHHHHLPNGHSHAHEDHHHGHNHGHGHDVGHSHSHGHDHHHHSHGHSDGHGHHDHSHSHHDHSDHGHSHGHSHNMKGVFLHVMADTLGSVGVIISTLLINRYSWTGFDPLASIFIAVLIFASVLPLVQDSAKVLVLDLGSEREQEVRKALAQLSSVEGLSSYAAPRFWPKDPGTIVGSIHIQLAPSPSSHDPSRPHEHDHRPDHHQHYAKVDRVVARVESVLRKAIDGLGELTVQVEGTDGLKNCFCLTRSGAE